MITSENKKNHASYLKLYDAVMEYMKSHDSDGNDAESADFTQAMMEADDTITSLDELFSYMKELRLLKPQFTRLPLDEPYFLINANTRVISIPEEFSKTGTFSVEGDEIAESVYFKIDRFYDHMDLATQDIFIQYVNAKGEESASVPPVVDIESEPGFIIFEWPISSKVTAAAGNVQFSVRFFTYDNTEIDEEGRGGKIVYSLSTLPATLAVKASQNFDLVHIEEDVALREDNSTLMKNRLTNSPIYGTAAVAADEPSFFTDFQLPEKMNLGVDDEGFTSEPVPVLVQAYASNGSITYHWEKTTLDKEMTEIQQRAKMVETKDTTPVEGKVYYLAKKNDEGGITGYSLVGSIEAFDDDKKPYWERVSEGIIDSVGYYVVTATNRVKNETADTSSKVCYVPAASDPKVEDINTNLVLSFSDDTDKFEGTLVNGSTTQDDGGKLTYQWYYSKDGEEFTAIDGATGDSYTISGDAAMTAPAEDEDGNPIYDDTPITENGKLDVGDNDPIENLVSVGNGIHGKDNETGNDVIFSPAVEDGHASGDGYYKVEVINNLNNTTKSGETNVCRVTHTAIKPDVETKVGIVGLDKRVKVESQNALDAEKGLVVEAFIPEFACEARTDDDSLTYQWYRYSSVNLTQAKLDADSLVAAEGKYVLDNDYRIKGATSSKFVPTEADLAKGSIYFCRVLNTYNGTKAMRCSSFFEITTLNE